MIVVIIYSILLFTHGVVKLQVYIFSLKLVLRYTINIHLLRFTFSSMCALDLIFATGINMIIGGTVLLPFYCLHSSQTGLENLFVRFSCLEASCSLPYFTHIPL